MRRLLGLLVLLALGCNGVVDDDDATGDDDDATGDDDDSFAVAEVCHDGSQDYETIQAAVDGEASGATILVCPGTYEENVVVDGKELTIRATGGAGETTVEAGSAGAVWTVSGVGGAGVVIDGFTLTGGEGGTGGGVACSGATIDVRSCVIVDNEAADGGGLGASGCQLMAADNVVEDNEATGFGGGVYLGECDGTFAGNLIQGNEGEQGGGIAVRWGTVAIEGNVIDDNLAGSWAKYAGGGGLYLEGEAPASDNTISHNEAYKHGGGVYLALGGGEFRDNHVSANLANEDGGGVYVYIGTNDILDNTIRDNEAYDDAGGLRVMSGSCLIQGNEVIGNVAADDGGGVKLSHAASVFDDNWVEANQTGDEGGGLELDNDVSPVTASTFVDNRAGRGGGIHSGENFADVWIATSTFTGNVASDRGGAIQLEEDPFEATLFQLWIEDNQAIHGGGVCVTGSVVAASNLVLKDNRALAQATLGGGGMYLEDAEGWLANLTLVGNQSDATGGLGVQDAGDLTVANTIVADSGGVGVMTDGSEFAAWAYNDVVGSAVVDYSMIDDPTGTDGNLSVDPAFVDVDAGDLRLDAGSPCIDAGSPALSDPDGSRSDMGAYGGEHGDW